MDLMLLLGVPSIISGIFMLIITWIFNRQSKKREVLEQTKLRMQILTINGLVTSITLGECTVKAIKEIDPKANGNLNKDLLKATSAKEELTNFLQEVAVKNIS